MRWMALASDYDGTLAQDGHLSRSTVEAVQRFRASGRRMLMVTGRELPELQEVCPHLDLFDVVVAENGGLLYWPRERREELLASPIPPEFVAEMTRLQVRPFSLGKSIFATWRPHEQVVQECIERMGIDYHVIFNKRAVMVLHSQVTKASGLTAAAQRMNLSPARMVGVGDAENDFAFLRLCGVSAAVANALPALLEGCDIALRGDHGRGVTELMERILKDDLQPRLRPPSDDGLIARSKKGTQ